MNVCAGAFAALAASGQSSGGISHGMEDPEAR